MSTINESTRVNGLRVNTKILINESNNSDTNADSQTPGSGLFIKPSTVIGRSANVTGFLVTSSNETGKLEFSDPDGFLALGDLSDVTLTSPVENNLLSYDGTEWVNTPDISPDSVTITKSTVTQATDINTAVTLNASAGVITTVTPDTLAQVSDTFTVNNTSVLATSVVIAHIVDYGGAYGTNGLPVVNVDNIAAGSFDIVILNADMDTALGVGPLQIAITVL